MKDLHDSATHDFGPTNFSTSRLLDSSTSPIACLLSEREAAIRGEELAGGLFAAVEEVAELLDGYAYRFSGDGSQLEPLLEFITAERRCCPFLTFELAFEPHGGPLWLRLRGSQPVKALIAVAFNTRIS